MAATFAETLAEMQQLHSAKSHDYDAGQRPFESLRDSSKFLCEPWVYACMLVNNKLRRVQSFMLAGELKNEGVRDSLLDAAVYAVIALTLYDEAQHGN